MERSAAASEILATAVASMPGIETEEEFGEPRPGRYEGTKDPYLVYVLHTVSMDTAWVDDVASDGEFNASRIGQFILTQTGQGFCDVEEYEDVAAAEDAFEALHIQLEGEFDEDLDI